MRSAFASCPRQFFWRYMQGRARSATSIHLHFGSCFAAGLATTREAFYGDGLDERAAIAAGAREITQRWGSFDDPHETKTFPRCLEALEAYFAEHPLALDHITPLKMDNGQLGVEFSAAVPLPIPHPETGEPILFSGRFDMLARYGALNFVHDDKTTTQLGPSWGRQWRMRGQFSGYKFLASEFGYRIDGISVRGISILKRGFGHAEVIEQRPDWQVREWHYQFCHDVSAMIDYWRASRASDFRSWPQNLDEACASYGGCPYQDLCSVEDPTPWLSNYEQVHYDPLAVQE